MWHDITPGGDFILQPSFSMLETVQKLLRDESHHKKRQRKRAKKVKRALFFFLPLPSLWSDNEALRTTRPGSVRGCRVGCWGGVGGCRLGPAPALSYAFVRQKHLPVAGAGSRRDAAEVFPLRSTQPAELSGQVGGLSHHPVHIGIL